MRRALAQLLIASASLHCSADGSLELLFPDERTRSLTQTIAFTAYEPLYQHENGDLELLTCARAGVFPPPRLLDPEKLGGAGAGRLLSPLREATEYPAEDFDFEFPSVPESDQTNPWGVVQVLVEARASVQSTDPGLGSRVSTIASGCTCFRTREGQGRDARFDTEVRQACPLLADNGEREIKLEPVLPPGFIIEPCTRICSTAAPGAPSGGAAACIREVPCGAGAPKDCFRCPDGDCPEQYDYSNVPVFFEMGDKSEVLLSESTGDLRSSMMLDACEAGLKITARALGRSEPDFELPLACVPAIGAFTCSDRTIANEGDPISFHALSGAGVAILYEGTASSVELFDPSSSASSAVHRFPGQKVAGSMLYQYDLAGRSRPVLAVATTESSRALVHLLEPLGGQLVETASLTPSCAGVSCAADDCARGPEVTARARFDSADLDGDQRADLAITGDTGEAITMAFLSGTTLPADLYSGTGCTCGRFGTAGNNFVLSDFGGELNGVVDLIFGNVLGSFAVFGSRDGAFPDCAGPTLLERAPLVRDIEAASFGCDPNSPEEKRCGAPCSAGRDLVVVAGSAQGIFEGDVIVLLALDEEVTSTGRSQSNYRLRPPDLSADIDALEAESGDFNGDGFDDLAVLYGGPGEVRVWLGAGNGALSLSPAKIEGCPAGKLAVADFDGDGADEIALLCRENNYEFRRCVPESTQLE